ncbi:MAG: type II toxin-antitoxin system VapC family toxin [Polyangiaceae bacterium]|nr:type II toxin-antitoxin system VapC family toxin [Polyangiaceae bacterium]
MVKFLLDTNALSEPVRARPDRRFMRRLRANAGEVAISSVTWHEAVFGLHRMPEGKRKDAIRAYLFETVAPTTPILPYDTQAAEVHGAERARLERLGRAPTFADGQIAGVAIANALILVTANAKDFARFDGLAVENWLA